MTKLPTRSELINSIRKQNEIQGGLFEMTLTDLENLLASRDEMVIEACLKVCQPCSRENKTGCHKADVIRIRTLKEKLK